MAFVRSFIVLSSLDNSSRRLQSTTTEFSEMENEDHEDPTSERPSFKRLLELLQSGSAVRRLRRLVTELDPMSISEVDEDGCTLLMHALHHGQDRLARLLWERNSASSARKSAYNETCLHFAAMGGSEECVALVWTKINPGTDLEEVDDHGYTSLHWAVELGHLSAARRLLELGARIDTHQAESNGSILHLAIRKDKATELMSLLLEKSTHKDVNLNVQDVHGRTALMEGIVVGTALQPIRALVLHKASVEVVDRMGLTALHLAAREDGQRSGELAKLILGASRNLEALVTQKDCTGQTVLDMALRGKNVKFVSVLARHTRVEEDHLWKLILSCIACRDAVGVKELLSLLMMAGTRNALHKKAFVKSLLDCNSTENLPFLREIMCFLVQEGLLLKPFILSPANTLLNTGVKQGVFRPPWIFIRAPVKPILRHLKSMVAKYGRPIDVIMQEDNDKASIWIKVLPVAFESKKYIT